MLGQLSNSQFSNHAMLHTSGLAHCRYGNEPCQELQIAAAEQMKITELRLQKLVGPDAGSGRQEGPLALAARRAGQIRAQLGASAVLASCAGN
jgi:hypothetical protein